MQEDIQDVVKLAVTPPEEAAKNIDRAKLFDVGPDNYVELKPQLEPEAINYEYPPSAEAATTEYMKLSTQNASLAKPETGILDYVARQGKFINHIVNDVPTNAQNIIELANEDMDSPTGLDENKKEILKGYNLERQQLSKDDFGITGFTEQLPAHIAGTVADMYRAVKDNGELITGVTATGTVVGAIGGAIGGSVIPGVGTLTGAVGGAIEGAQASLIPAFTLSQFAKGYKDTKGTVYNDLSFAKDDKGNDLNLSRETKANIANGVAIVSGAASAFVGHKLAKGNPFLSKFLSPSAAAEIVSNPALRAKIDILGYMGRSAFSGGGAAAVAEFSKIVGEEFAKTDKTPASFENVISNLTSEQSRERLLKSFTIGAASAGTIALATSTPFYSKIKQNYVEINKKIGSMLGEDQIVIHEDGSYSLERKGGLGPGMSTEEPVAPTDKHFDDSVKVLKAQDSVMNMVKATSTTNMRKLSPAEVTNFNKMMFRNTGMDQKFYVTKEDLQQAATTPEIGEKLRNMIDPSGVLNSQINAPMAVEPHKFLDIVEEFPSVSDYIRLHPGGPNANEARNHLEKIQTAHATRQEILAGLGVDKTLTPEQQAQAEQALSAVNEATQPFNESEYYDAPTFTPAIEGVLTKEKVEVYNTAQLDARLAVGKSLKEDVTREFDAKANVAFRATREAQIKTELAEHDAALNIINQFTTKEKNSLTNRLTGEHRELGKFSPYGIDPRYLPDDVREAVTSDPNLIKRKVFVIGGLSPDEAATMLKVDSGENLIKILANTPDKKDIIKRKEQLNIELKNQIQQAFKPEKELATTEAFTNLSKAHMREMQFMREQDWSQTKIGVKAIALPLPKIPEINARATEIVRNTPIKDLDHRQYVVGERKSQRAAVDHILNNEVEQAFKAKENAIFNSELAKETLIAKNHVKKAEAFLKKLDSPELQQELKDAKMFDPINELLEAYNFDTSRKGLAKKGSFNKWVKDQVEMGNVDLQIPDKFNDIRESSSELSAEQYLAITDRVKSIVHQAKMKNKLYNKFKEKEMIQTEEAIVTTSGQLLEQHPDFSLKRAMEAEIADKSLTTSQTIGKFFRTLESTLTNAENVIAQLDEDKLAGFHRELLSKPLRDAQTAENFDNLAFVEHFKKNVAIYGEKQFNKMFTDRVSIPEFKNYPSLGLGELPKKDLLKLLSYMGDPYTREKMSNYVSIKGERLSPEIIMPILERELTLEDARFYQNMMANTFKSLEARSAALHLETTGEEARMAKGQAFEFKGVMLEGGYSPAKYQFTPEEVKIGRFIEAQTEKVSSLLGGTEGRLYGQLKAAEMTEQGRFESRTGSTRPLDISFNNFITDIEETFHDLNFRKAGIDNLKLLKNPIMVRNIKAVVGDAKYKLLVDSSIEVIGGMKAQNENYFGDKQRLWNDIFSMGEKGFALTILSANLSSIAIQPVSLVNLGARMGSTGPMYIAKSSAMLATNIHRYGEIRKIAEELNPSIKFHKDAIDESLIKTSYSFLSSKSLFFKKYKKTENALNTIKSGQDFSMNFLMSGLSEADAQIKIVETFAGYMQFVEGNVENYPKERLAKMSNKEIYDGAKNYVEQLASLSLTASATYDKTIIEKLPMMRFFNKFFTDPRSQLNTAFSQRRKIKWGYKKAKEGFKEGDQNKAYQGAKYATGALLTAVIASSLTRLIEDVLRGNETPLDDLKEVKTEEDFFDFSKKASWYVGTSVPSLVAQNTPFLREGLYAYNKKSKRTDYKSVQIPIMKMYSDITTGISGLADILDMDEMTDPSNVEIKAMLMSAGYLTGGLPINGVYKMKKYLENETVETATDFIKNESKRLNENINKYIEKNKDNPKAKEYIDDLQQVQKEVLPKYDNDVRKVIPENIKETFKTVLSNGDWTKLDPSTGAVGIYQYSEDRWNEIKNSAPALGLTDNGRVSKDSKQQEKALDWEIKDNTRGFISYDIPVDTKNLLGAHKFGFDNYVSIYNAKDSEKLSKVLGNNINDPVFDKFKIVKDVKVYLSKELNKINE